MDLQALLERTLAGMGYELVALERSGRGPLLRVFIDKPEGIVMRSTRNAAYTALRPTLEDFVLEMPRGAQVIYPKDLAPICMLADIGPGMRVFESGLGGRRGPAGAPIVGSRKRRIKRLPRTTSCALLIKPGTARRAGRASPPSAAEAQAAVDDRAPRRGSPRPSPRHPSSAARKRCASGPRRMKAVSLPSLVLSDR